MNNAAIAIQLLITLLEQAGTVSKLIQDARTQGRDISDAEIANLVADDDAARAFLEAEINKAT